MEQEDFWQSLLERRAEKFEEIAAAEKTIEQIDALLKTYFGDDPRTVNARRRRGSTIQDHVLVESFRLLEQLGPMRRKTLVEKLVERGVQFGSKNPGKYVGRILANDHRFTTDGRGEWSLTGQEVDPQRRAF